MWLDKLVTVEETQHRDYFQAYFIGLAPRHLKDAEHLEKYKALHDRYKDNVQKAHMVKLLQEEIAHMELIISIQQKQIQ